MSLDEAKENLNKQKYIVSNLEKEITKKCAQRTILENRLSDDRNYQDNTDSTREKMKRIYKEAMTLRGKAQKEYDAIKEESAPYEDDLYDQRNRDEERIRDAALLDDEEKQPIRRRLDLLNERLKRQEKRVENSRSRYESDPDNPAYENDLEDDESYLREIEDEISRIKNELYEAGGRAESLRERLESNRQDLEYTVADYTNLYNEQARIMLVQDKRIAYAQDVIYRSMKIDEEEDYFIKKEEELSKIKKDIDELDQELAQEKVVLESCQEEYDREIKKSKIIETILGIIIVIIVLFLGLLGIL